MKNQIKTAKKPCEVPLAPAYESLILGLNHSAEVEEALPGHVHPWMPSLKGTRKRQEEALKKAKKEETEKEGDKVFAFCKF